MGEADRSFRRGLTLEKAGMARAASAAYHEAATLYQCFLDFHGGGGEEEGEGDGMDVTDETVHHDDDHLDTHTPDDPYLVDHVVVVAVSPEAEEEDENHSPNPFAHVTGHRGPTRVRSVLARILVSLAYLNRDALGDNRIVGPSNTIPTGVKSPSISPSHSNDSVLRRR